MTGTHIICDADPNKVVTDVAKFIDKKQDTKLDFSTTPVLIGVLPNGQPNLMILTSCLIRWETTEADWKSFQFAQRTLLTKP